MSQIREVTASNIDDHWLEWLLNAQSFRYVPPTNAPFTVRKEKSRRGDGDYWYGYRKVEGKLHKRYIGKAEDLTVNRLEEVAAQLIIPTSPRPLPKVPSGSFTQNEEITRVLAENARLENELQKSRSEGTYLTVELEAVRSLKDKLQNELQKSRSEGTSLTVELEAVRFDQDKLQKKLQKSLDEGKNLAVKLEAVRLEKDKLQKELQRVMKLGDEVNALRGQLKQENRHKDAVSRERDKLQIELQKKFQTQDLPPDYQAVRDRTLNKLKLGRQSIAGKTLDAFIKELQKEN